jgi:hypothetical protein
VLLGPGKQDVDNPLLPLRLRDVGKATGAPGRLLLGIVAVGGDGAPEIDRRVRLQDKEPAACARPGREKAT